MPLIVVGSIAIDSVQTPKASVEDFLGGSASHFAYASSFFTPTRVVGVVGQDFPESFFKVLSGRPNIDTAGVKREAGKTFRWKGRYSPDMNSRETLEVHLNVFGQFDPDVPESYRDSRFVFLANASPVVQRKVLHQVREPKLVFADTMDLWIETQRDELLELLRQIDGLVLNDQEALLLTQEPFVVLAGQKILELGPKYVIVKKGEHGSMLFHDGGVLCMPAFPTSRLVDPTGAGDSFAGAFMGCLASAEQHDLAAFKRAIAYGTVVASFNVEGFGLDRIRQIERSDVEERFAQYRAMLQIA